MKLLTLATLALSALSAASEARFIKRGPINNSGTIPGTNITVYGLVDLKTGKPLDYEEFVQGFIHTPSVNPEVLSRKTLSKRGGEFDERAYIRKYCIPQVSVNPEANPYHRSLTGREDINYFIGIGQGIPFPNSGTDCRKSAQDCPIALTKDITYTNAIAFSVSDSDSNSLTGTLGGSETITNSSSTSETVAHTLEKNWSHTNSHTEDYSLATTTGEIITAGNSSSSNDVKIRTDGRDWGSGTNENEENGENSNSEKHWNVNVDVPFVSAGGGGSESKGKTHSKSNGSNTHDNFNYQDGWNNGTTKEDNWSRQTQNLQTETRGSSDTTSDTTGGSESTTNSVMKTKGIDVSIGKEWSKSNSTTKEHGVTQGNTTTTASSSGITRTFYVPSGKCMGLACFPKAEMLVIPHICVDTQEQIAERVAISIAKYATKSQEMECLTAGLIDCEDLLLGTSPFVTYDETYLSIGAKNTLRVTGAIDANNPLISNNGDFLATVESNGNFVVYRTGNIKVWESGATPFVAIEGVNRYKHRVRINMRGHLVVETMNMFSKIPKFQTNIFRQVWSTQPISNNFTVGTPRRPDSPYDDYVLILDDKGRLNLYDAMYIKIWCTYDKVGNNCGNTKGYRYQENYLVPTDFPTPDPGLGPMKDPHNSIIYPTSFLPSNSFMSKDANCTDGISSGSGIQSPNGRFKVILYPTGNLIIKDGTRTMWTSNTASMERTTGPFKLFLNDAGDLVIADATKRWTWLGENKVSRTTGPFQATITDAGRFVVTDSKGTEVWESWPHNNMSPAYMFFATARYCYDKCGECVTTVNATAEVTNIITVPPVTVTTTMTTTTTAPIVTPTPAPNPESILNKCKAWMDQYKIDPFVSWGSIEKNAEMQAQWIYYDCACFGAYLKYNVEILRTHLGKWGSLKSSSIRKQYTDSYCNCPLAQDVYKITPNPKNWGSLKDTAQQTQWTKEGCDENVNREPFVTNAIGKGTTMVPTWTTLANYTTNIYDNYFTSFTNTTTTTIGVNVTTGADSKITSAIITTFLTNATMAVTDSQTVSITTGYTITAVRPTATTTIPPRTTTTNGPAPTCTGGKPGAGDGSGSAGQCCKTDNDCNDSCRGGKCGVCGTDFAC